MKKQKIWPVIAVSAVFLIACLMLLSKVFVPKQISNNSTSKLWEGFYREPENSVDVLFLGPSTVYYGISPTEMYDKFGFTSYALASPDQRMLVTELYLREALKTQSPRLVVIDSTLFFDENVEEFETHYRTALDHLKLSWDKLKTARNLVSQDDRQSLISYVFPLFRYHGRWSDDLGLPDFNLRPDAEFPGKGYAPGVRRGEVGTPLYLNPTEEIDDSFDANALEHLCNIMALCEENSAELLLIKMPVISDTYTYARHNASVQLAEEIDVSFLDLNTKEYWTALELNPETDFVSENHLIFYASAKVAPLLGGYIAENYDLPDHRGDMAYSGWNKAVTDTRVNTLEKTRKGLYDTNGTVGAVETEEGVRVYWALPIYCKSVNLSYKDSTGETVTLLQGSTAEEAIFTDLPTGGDFKLQYNLRNTERTVTLTFHAFNSATATAVAAEDAGV